MFCVLIYRYHFFYLFCTSYVFCGLLYSVLVAWYAMLRFVCLKRFVIFLRVDCDK